MGELQPALKCGSHSLRTHCKNSGKWAEGWGSGSQTLKCQKKKPSNHPSDAKAGAPSGGHSKPSRLGPTRRPSPAEAGQLFAGGQQAVDLGSAKSTRHRQTVVL